MLIRNYLREEEFLDEYGNWALAVASLVDGEWSPNYSCDDNTRQQRDYFVKTAQLASLQFNSAAVLRDLEGKTFAQVVLESSFRVLTVKVGGVGVAVHAEIILDKKK